MTVLTVAEHRNGRLRGVSREAQTAARELAEATGDTVHTAVVGGDVERFGETLACDGIDMVHTVAEGDGVNHDVVTQALSQLVAAVDARAVLAPHSVTALDYTPALAARLDWPVVTDTVALDGEDGLTVTREMGGGLTTLAVEGGRAVVTLRPGEWPAAEGTGDAEVVPFVADIDEAAVRSTVTGGEQPPETVALDEADVVVAVGRGIGGADALDVIFDLADSIGGTVAASGPPVKRGWLPADRLVGQSGATVAPDVYLAIGLSGATQHLAGMRESDVVVAINSDPTAPIFDVADYGVVADLFDVVPALASAFQSDDE